MVEVDDKSPRMHSITTLTTMADIFLYVNTRLREGDWTLSCSGIVLEYGTGRLLRKIEKVIDNQAN